LTRTLIHHCPQCSQYTMAETCPRCHVATKSPLPPKFSPEDAYGAYRRKLRRLTSTPPGA
jgi:H/ACA ribonucleoprotein complex subunit 3